MIERIIIAGAGGQGIMLLGKVLAQAAMEENRSVTWLPSYGAEVRGGTANCTMVVSDSEIGSPYVDKADTLIVMNEPSLVKFKNRLAPEGLLIVNTSLVKSPVEHRRCIKLPISDIAVKLGNIKVANMVALGCYLDSKHIVEKETVIKVIESIAPPDKKALIAINKAALSAGSGLKPE